MRQGGPPRPVSQTDLQSSNPPFSTGFSGSCFRPAGLARQFHCSAEEVLVVRVFEDELLQLSGAGRQDNAAAETHPISDGVGMFCDKVFHPGWIHGGDL